jgi:hypothetical protein
VQWGSSALRALCSVLAGLLEAPGAGSLGPAVWRLLRLGQVTPGEEQPAMMAQHIWCVPIAMPALPFSPQPCFAGHPHPSQAGSSG